MSRNCWCSWKTRREEIIRSGSIPVSTAAIRSLCSIWRGDPELEKWFANADFRRALSIALDRDQFNEAFWLGLGSPDPACRPRSCRKVPARNISRSGRPSTKRRPTRCWTPSA
ncbi:MAG: hypothetical protein EXR05_07030 [Acetobacteraceae bacterium]|nr:hypothetical protein [Acetobacteraceae bacterium]MSP30666.1 hypothetical protein [Acetobacteraceae bacterium]